jgi:hypothetical protein
MLVLSVCQASPLGLSSLGMMLHTGDSEEPMESEKELLRASLGSACLKGSWAPSSSDAANAAEGVAERHDDGVSSRIVIRSQNGTSV